MAEDDKNEKLDEKQQKEVKQPEPKKPEAKLESKQNQDKGLGNSRNTNFFRVTVENGKALYIRKDEVAAVTTEADFTSIVFRSGKVVAVTEKLEQVTRLAGIEE